MPGFYLLQHKNFQQSIVGLPPAAQRKAIWSQVLLGVTGRTPVVKGTVGPNARWRRSPVQGNHYYLWWIPQSESGVDSPPNARRNGLNTILIHSVRHHDLTDQPLLPGALDDYAPLSIDTLDPRFEEQRVISRPPASDAINVAAIKGLPGSGKTVALLYLLRDLLARDDGSHIVYVTYTTRLKRAAREFVESHFTARTGLPPEALRSRLRIFTLNELVSDLTGLAMQAEPFGEMAGFTAFLQRQNPADLGLWRAYPRTLFTEIRAHLLGRDFPADYDWAQENLGGGGIDLLSYAQERELNLDEAERAVALAERVRTMRFFRDQAAARTALSQVIAGQAPGWLAKVDALVVDEVQDLTLIQIALVTELLRLRAQRNDGRGLTLAIAGDESQIVQPSGFDWGMTKYMTGEQLGIWPDEFEFQHQRRSPDNLAQLIDNSWNFYSHLRKSFRPSARRARMAIEQVAGMPDMGQIFITPLPGENENRAELLALVNHRDDLLADDDGENAREDAFLSVLPADLADRDVSWAALMLELAGRPGRALVDLSETLTDELPPSVQSLADEIIYLPREIKGLERHTILIHGLNAHYVRARDLSEDKGLGSIPRYEARRLFDEMRVALSRSTYRLILLEEADAPVLAELGVAELDGVAALSWADLILAMQTEEISEIEAIEGYLREVEDLADRSRWSQAVTRNRRAYRLARRMGDRALQSEAERQHAAIYLQQASGHLAEQNWPAAYEANRQARDLAGRADDPDTWRRVDEQLARIQAQAQEELSALLTASTAAREAGAPGEAYARAADARALIAILPPGSATEAVDDALADAAWLWALELVNSAEDVISPRAAELLDEIGAIMAGQGADVAAAGMGILAERYRTVPGRRRLNEEMIARILAYAEAYLQLLDGQPVESTLYAHIGVWLRDTYVGLEEHFPLYYRWSVAAERMAGLTGESSYRQAILRLEQRLDAIFDRAGAMGQLWDGDQDLHRFRILLSGLHGGHAEASVAWEALDELPQAADQARLAGDPERAYQLLRTANLPIDEELATAVKFLRLLEQVEQKHGSLRPNERAALRRRMDELTTQLE
ncbi:MAG: AAA family ATPase [Caldilineaceae bacterium]|nr:AAA family ATPase [Caldilineaceae bacterium]